MSDSDSESTMSFVSYLTPETPEKLQPGIYNIINYISKTAVDLSGADQKTIISYPVHGGDNQQWIFEPLGAGYSIRSVLTGGYMTVNAGLQNGTPIVASPFPVSWEIKFDSSEGDDAWRIHWPYTDLVFNMADHDSVIPGTEVQLWDRLPSDQYGLWYLVRCDPKEVTEARSQSLMSDGASATADTVMNLEELRIGGDGNSVVTVTSTTTTTTTTTTITKIMRNKSY